jgi:hypothetical protein
MYLLKFNMKQENTFDGNTKIVKHFFRRIYLEEEMQS